MLEDRTKPTTGLVSGLEHHISWDTVLAAPRYAGGHEEVMRSIFGNNSTVEAWWAEDDYQGTVAIAHKLVDGSVAVMTDYYGSCSGCDCWEGASDEDARKQVLDIVHNARVFENLDDAKAWCATVDSRKEPSEYPFEAAKNLWKDEPPTEPEMVTMTPQDQLAAMVAPPPEPTDDTMTTAPESDMAAFKLGDEFDAALIGATITGLYAYSLTRLSMIVMQEMNVHPETAQKMVAKQVMEIMQIHGADSPVFVDDSLMMGFGHVFEGESEVPTEGIYTGETPEVPSAPYVEGHPDNVILIPGVTHGACKGFLDPEGLTSK